MEQQQPLALIITISKLKIIKQKHIKVVQFQKIINQLQKVHMEEEMELEQAMLVLIISISVMFQEMVEQLNFKEENQQKEVILTEILRLQLKPEKKNLMI